MPQPALNAGMRPCLTDGCLLDAVPYTGRGRPPLYCLVHRILNRPSGHAAVPVYGPNVMEAPDARHLPKRMRRWLWHRVGERCEWCDRDLPLWLADLDHVVPRSRGGGDEPGNLMVLCPTCHAYKSRWYDDQL
jgi:hypothetical protein